MPKLWNQTLRQASYTIRKIIAPIAPHLAEELHEHSGGKDSFFLDTWVPGVSFHSLVRLVLIPSRPIGKIWLWVRT